MTEVTINGIKFNAADGEPSDMLMFDEDNPKATDTAPWGMVEEMKAFIRIQDEINLRSLVDIGALFGVFSLVFTRYPEAKAVALEPSPWAYGGLTENVALNPGRQIQTLFCFCGETTGEVVACGRQWKHVTPNRWPDDNEVVPMGVFALDDIASARSCDCIKIDVEGYEGPVLRGARRLIERQKPIIFLECHFSVLKEVSGDTRETLFNFFKEVGYEVKTFQGERVHSFPDALPSRYVCWPST